ncbi:MAG: FAD-dependent monooxygenase [Gammaproteobacteria bacterium]
MPSHPRARVIVAGGSLAGLIVAALLRRAGMAVTILERSRTDLAARGAGIVVHDALFEALDGAGVDRGHTANIHSGGRQVFNNQGAIVARRTMEQQFTAWGTVYRLLRRIFPSSDYHLGRTVTATYGDGKQVVVETADGDNFTADWLIAADGSRSSLRRDIPGTAAPHYAGYVAWRGLVLESALDTADRELLGSRMSFALPPGEHMLCYLVAGPEDDLRPGHRWYNWVWYRGADADLELPRLTTGVDGTRYDDGIPPHAIAPAAVAAMRDAALTRLPPVFRAVIAATPQPFLQVVNDAMTARMVHGRVILIGDAAFTARPHVGLGVSKAAGDAYTLMQALTEPDADVALRRWEDARVRFGTAAVAWGRRLGSYIGAIADTPDARALAAYYAEPEAVMEQVATAHPEHFLHDGGT